MELGWIGETDGQAAADALVSNHARLVEAEAAEFALAAHWADLHDERTLVRGDGSGRVLPGTEQAKRYGGAGTPLVGEFAAAELGCLLSRGHIAATTLIADAIDVRHRLPMLWSAVHLKEARVWQARQVASRTRSVGLTFEQARWVDGETTPYLASLQWSRFQDLLEAKIIEADPEAAQARADAAAMERFVATGQCNEYGLKTVIAKADAGDAIFFVAMCDRIAQVLLLEGDTDPVGARRSKALGILANPAVALALLTKHANPLLGPVEPTPGEDSRTHDEPLTPGDLHPGQDDSDDEPEAACPTCGGTGAPTGDSTAFIKRLATIDPGKLLPAVTLYLHISQESFSATLAEESTGVARLEGVGPITVDQARDFLRHAHVTIKPVIDLDADHPVDGHEVPDRLREQVHLRTPADVFPWSGNMSRRKDLDHSIPYLGPDKGGPPGQTRIANLGPMNRFGHRVKTHARGWRHRQPVPGVFLWRTPHGYWYRVDHTGTYPLGKNPSPWELAGRPDVRIDIARWHRPRPDPRSPAEAAFATQVKAA